MIFTASFSLLSLIVSALLMIGGLGSPPAVIHLAFAVGIIPLIFAAMIHFVPVLTRTGDPSPLIGGLPVPAQLLGLLVPAAMQGWVPYELLYGVATVDLIFAAILLRWIASRAHSALGSPHPGWRWYGAALGCLILAMGSVLSMAIWPLHGHSLRLFHLHINTLGLVGLAALGTLPVLLPTAIGQADPDAAGWLRRRLWPVAFGALIVAAGAVINWAFATPGVALLLVAALGLLGQWVRRFGLRTLLEDGVAASLSAALFGLMLTLTAGLLHGIGLLPARPSIAGWTAGFLLPLVTGALSQLLPVWRWPGPTIPARGLMRRQLAASGRWRSALFIAGAMAVIVGQEGLAGLFVGMGMILFVIGVIQAVRVPGSTR